MNRFVANSKTQTHPMTEFEARTGFERARGGFVNVDGEAYYCIHNVDRLQPFLMSLPSDTDLWMFIASTGGLTMGRVDAECAIFPYETVDKLYVSHDHTGPLTIFRIFSDEGTTLWQPFEERREFDSRIERNLYKTAVGNRLLFEEIHHGLSLRFRSRWSSCDRFGFVRTNTIENLNGGQINCEVLDGFRNVMPFGIPLALQNQSSCLADAYKQSEFDADARMALFSLTAKIVDRPEPAEMLRANTVWCHGLQEMTASLSPDAPKNFRFGIEDEPVHLVQGQRGNFFLRAAMQVGSGAIAKWHLAADTGLDHVAVSKLRARLLEGGDLDREIEADLQASTDALRRCVGSADGIQATADSTSTVHHFANVLFNNMRGGVFDSNYRVERDDFIDFVRTRNLRLADRQGGLLKALPPTVTRSTLIGTATASGDAEFQRICCEYLPIYFGRRHGDPSRPWNQFSINVRNSDGSRALRYEGNWRDIFQNWEALSQSFPGFLPSFIAKFLNASTVDGFNPYRITRDGLDWEVLDPHDPWSHIGYWGDHQIIYLLKMLEAHSRFHPGQLESSLASETFSYADVPYRIKSYRDLVADPHNTIEFDQARADLIDARARTLGTDAKLLHNADGEIVHVSLIEKLLVPALSKLSNFVPGGGIWMNTQRPEWNDANNALVGNGISMVTLCYLRRYLQFVSELVSGTPARDYQFSAHVVCWLKDLKNVLSSELAAIAQAEITDEDRRRFLDAAGEAFSRYRKTVYAEGLDDRSPVSTTEIGEFLADALDHVDHSIRANQREDSLYHSYNLIATSSDAEAMRLGRLGPMLEGQVAVLSSGLVGAAEACDILRALYDSGLYRADQDSFLLYPAKKLPGFREKNSLGTEELMGTKLCQQLLSVGDQSVVARDAEGRLCFNGDIHNRADVERALAKLGSDPRWKDAVESSRDAFLDVFEKNFQHARFTGRSGTMFGYEGLGCIYWHMVSKLLLAVQEIIQRDSLRNEEGPSHTELVEFYYRIRKGLGFEKSVENYGAFPTDPYSHTPSHSGAKQPGMTGQVKEEILTRFGELGVVIQNGCMSFQPILLRRAEFFPHTQKFRYFDLQGEGNSIVLEANSLAFTYCQVPVIYTITEATPGLRVVEQDGSSHDFKGRELDAELSQSIFERRDRIQRIEVTVNGGELL